MAFGAVLDAAWDSVQLGKYPGRGGVMLRVALQTCVLGHHSGQVHNFVIFLGAALELCTMFH